MRKFIAGILFGCMAGFMLFSGCMQGSNHLVVRIEGRDSITVREFQASLLETGSKDLTYEEKRKIALNMIHDRLKALSAVDAKIDQQEDIKKTFLQYENDIVRNEARTRYIYPHFLNDSALAFYMSRLGYEAEIKNFVYRYKDNPRSKITRSREEARRFVDSVFAVMDKNNYDTLTYQFSEYIDRQTGKGNYRPDRLKYGTLPYQYENTVFRAEPGSILQPIEIQGAFLIPWIVKYKADSAAARPKNKNEAYLQLKKKIESVDAGMLFEFYRNYADTLLAARNVRIMEPALDTFLRVVPSDKNIESIFQAVDERYYGLVLVESPGQENITLKSFLESYDRKNVLPRLSRENLGDILREQLRDHALIRKVREEGYTDSEDFRIAYGKKKNALLIQRIQPVRMVRPDSVPVEKLRRYYETHLDLFQTPGTVRIQEATSNNESALKEIAALYATGTAFEKAVDSVRTRLSKTSSDKNNLPEIKPPSVLSSNQADELARAAFSHNPDELTPVIARKDGGYSLIRILEKKEAVRQSFDTVRKKVENMVISDELRKQELNWLNEMKQKLTVIFYEQNLK